MMRNLDFSTPRAALGLATALLLLLAPGAARAVTIDLFGSNSGSGVTVTVGVSGIEALAEPSLGSYDFDLFFDSAVLAFSDIVFGPFLGGPADSLQSYGTSPGIVDFAEVSLIFPNVLLQALQPDSFVLATLHFESLVTEDTLTTVGLSQTLLADGNGSLIRVDPVTPIELEAAIPEASGAHVFALGLAVTAFGFWLSSGRRAAGHPARALLRTGS